MSSAGQSAFWRSRFFLVILVLTILSIPLAARSLTYDQATGKLDKFNVHAVPKKSNPSDYTGSAEHWDNDGYIGRLVYLGPPTTFTFTSGAPHAIGTSNNRFYFTLNNGTPKLDTWREYFLVVRAKGLNHHGSQDDFTQMSTVIAQSGNSYTIAHGAGSDTVEENASGYNAQGQSGINKNGSHPYKYPYRAIWIDVTQINTNNRTWGSFPTGGYYESHINITAACGVMIALNLSGQYLPVAWDTKPMVNTLAVDKIYDQPIPYSNLQWRTSASTALDIATIRYISTIDKAKVTISSDAAGIGTDFKFSATQGTASIPFKLLYQSTVNNLAPTLIDQNNKTFNTSQITVTSPIDNASYKQHELVGKIKLYMNPQPNPPAAGYYSSTIYVIVARQ